MAFTYAVKGETSGTNGMKRLWGTWDATGATSGTITFSAVYNPIAAGAVYSTTVTTATCPNTLKVSAGVFTLGVVDSGAAGYWWVDVQ